MSLPWAVVVHSSSKRVRIRIPASRGDHAYFTKVRKAARKARIEFIRVNSVTGSILFEGENATIDAVTDFGKTSSLYTIPKALPPLTLAKQVSTPLTKLNNGIKHVSAGQIDLPGALFILLLFTALYEIARGRFRTPPWYTAFWYAFGLFTKSLIDRENSPQQ